jgi:hypothetical protein
MSSVYERWIGANNALMACYEANSVETFNALSVKDQDNLCASEQKTVAAFLKDDSVNFKSILQARLAAMEQQH